MLALCLVGLILYLLDIAGRKKARMAEDGAMVNDKAGTAIGEESEECCGQHLVCEKDSLLLKGDEVEYFDDEELDRFAGKSADAYTPEEVTEIREVFETLREEEVAAWARSMAARRVELPLEIYEEMMLIIRDRRGIR